MRTHTHIDIYMDWDRSVDDRKSTSGEALFLDNSLVSWLRKKQFLSSMYTTYIEYIATKTC
jgi:hypothetical protein